MIIPFEKLFEVGDVAKVSFLGRIDDPWTQTTHTNIPCKVLAVKSGLFSERVYLLQRLDDADTLVSGIPNTFQAQGELRCTAVTSISLLHPELRTIEHAAQTLGFQL